MNIENLNQAFIEIAEKKNELSQFQHDNPEYVALQEEVHQLEAAFQAKYGHYIEEALFNVHDEYCPDNDVLLPVAYFATSYLKGNGGRSYDVDKHEGIPVEADDFPGIKARLVLVPNPTRLVLQGQSAPFKEVVWTARAPLEA